MSGYVSYDLHEPRWPAERNGGGEREREREREREKEIGARLETLYR